MFQADPIAVIPSEGRLSEGIIWDHRTGTFIWSDIKQNLLHRYQLETGEHRVDTLPEMVCSLGLTHNPDWLVAAFRTGFGYISLADMQCKTVSHIDMPEGLRMNDGRVGPDGALYAGSMVEVPELAGSRDAGKLYRFDGTEIVTSVLDNIQISNGLCWTADGRTVFHADSPTKSVRSWTGFEPSDETHKFGLPHARWNIEHGYPDGAVCDTKGHYWSALWGGSRVAVLDPLADGAEIYSVPLPVSQVTCPAFGGSDLNILAVTSAWDGLQGQEREPEAGHVFLFQTNATGQPSAIFRSV